MVRLSIRSSRCSFGIRSDERDRSKRHHNCMHLPTPTCRHARQPNDQLADFVPAYARGDKWSSPYWRRPGRRRLGQQAVTAQATSSRSAGGALGCDLANQLSPLTHSSSADSIPIPVNKRQDAIHSEVVAHAKYADKTFCCVARDACDALVGPLPAAVPSRANHHLRSGKRQPPRGRTPLVRSDRCRADLAEGALTVDAAVCAPKQRLHRALTSMCTANSHAHPKRPLVHLRTIHRPRAISIVAAQSGETAGPLTSLPRAPLSSAIQGSAGRRQARGP